jgi:hypothetical protein
LPESSSILGTMSLRAINLSIPTNMSAAGPRLRVMDLLAAAIVLLLVGNLGRVPVFSVGVKDTPVMLNDMMVGLVLAGATIVAFRTRQVQLDRAVVLALMFCSVGFLSALLAVPKFGLTIPEFVVSIAYLARWAAYFGIYLVVINFATAGDVRRVWTVTERVILAFATFGIFQSLFLPGFAQRVHPGEWDIQGHRLVSTFLDPNFAGALIAIGLLVLLAQMSFGVPVPMWKPILLSAALILTISRSSVLAFIAGGLLIVAVRGISRQMLKYAAVAGVLVLPFIPLIIEFATRFGRFSTGGSAAVRVVAWLRALEIFADNPVIGIGFNTYGFVQEHYGWNPLGGADFALDGGLLFIGVLTGVVGVTLYSGMLGIFLWRCRRVSLDRERDPFDRGLAVGIAAATVALLVHSIFLNSLLYPFLMVVMWSLWGLTAIMARSPTADLPKAAVPGFEHRPRSLLGSS